MDLSDQDPVRRFCTEQSLQTVFKHFPPAFQVRDQLI